MVGKSYIFLLDSNILRNLPRPFAFFHGTEPIYNMSIILTRLLDILQFAAHSNDCISRPEASNIVDPNSCNSFIMCTNTRTIRTKCPDNLFYDPGKDACEFPGKFDCVHGMRPTPMSTISSIANNTTALSAPSTISTNITTETVKIPSNICYRIEITHNVVGPESCTHFYTCVHTRPVRKACPPTLFYNREAGVCDFPSNVLCENGRRPNITATTVALEISSTQLSQSTEFPINLFTICQNVTDTPSSTGIGNTGFVPHPGSCIVFFRCEDRTVVERRKCVDGKYFNRDKKTKYYRRTIFLQMIIYQFKRVQMKDI